MAEQLLEKTTTPAAGLSRQPRFGPARREKVLRAAFLLPTIAYLIAFYAYPVVQNLVMGFQNYTTRTFFTGEAPWIGWGNYRAVIASDVFTRATVNTLVFTVGSIAGQFVIGLALAVFFRSRFPGAGLMRSLLLLPWLIPLVASTAIWRWLLDTDSGALNRFLSGAVLNGAHPGWLTSTSLALLSVVVVNIWVGIPFNATLLYSGLQDVPNELYEAGALDGATGWRAFRHITWPLLRPVVLVVLVLGVVYTLKALDIILSLTAGGPADSTQTIATQSYSLSFTEFDFGQGAALSTMLIALSLLFAVLYLRAARRGVDE